MSCVVLDQALGHVHPEPVRSLVEPEHHYVAEFLPDRFRAGSIDRLLPRMSGIRIGETIVQRRLGLVVILVVIFCTGSILFHKLADRTGFGIRLPVPFGNILLVLLADFVSPDVVVAVALVGIFLHRLQEPFVLVTGVTGHKVHNYLDPPFVRLLDQPDHVGIGSEPGIHLVVVDDVISSVHPSGLIDWIQPDGSDSDAPDVIEFRCDAVDVPDTVSVRIHVGGRIDLVEHRPVQPLGIVLGTGAERH